MMYNKTIIKFVALGAVLSLSIVSNATEVYSTMESEEQGVSTGTGLIRSGPDRPNQFVKDQKKRLPHTLPKHLKQPQGPTVAIPASQVTRIAPRASFPKMEIRVQRAATRPASIPSGARGAYDAVPSDQKDSIVRRLKIVEALIARHARAYDYRIHTIRELEAILAGLDNATLSPAQSSPAETDPARFPVEGTSQADPALFSEEPPPPPPTNPPTFKTGEPEPQFDIKPNFGSDSRATGQQ